MPSNTDRIISLCSVTCIGFALALFASAAPAHIVISPTESKLGKKETYTLTVPTEGASATTGVQLDVPPEVTVISVNGPAADYTLTKQNDRIVGITWRVNVPPGGGKELVFVAQNPQGPTRGIRWNVHQLFADGTRADWVDPPPSHPAPATRFLPK